MRDVHTQSSLDRPPRTIGPITKALLAWCAGLLVGSLMPGGWAVALAIAASGVLLIAALLIWRRRPAAVTQPLILLSIGLAAMACWSVRVQSPPPRDVSRLLQGRSVLIDVTGVIAKDPRVRFSTDEGLGRFIWSPPATRFILLTETLHGEGSDVPVAGGLLVAIPSVDVRWRIGDRVRVRGWLARISEPSNPGEVDFKQQMARMNVRAKLYAKHPGNVEMVEADASIWPSIQQWHASLCDHVADALGWGIDESTDPKAAALLDAMLLGRRSDALDDLYESFRRTGLAHVLAISGLHVGLLAVGVWFATQLVTGRPKWAAMIALIAVLLYMVIVPWRVPIVRAGFMTIVCCVGLTRRQRLSGMTLMSIIGLTLLVYRPADLFDPGFQLSFGIVAALLLFTNRLSRRLLPEPVLLDYRTTAMTLRRFGVDYLAVSVIAWLAALPIVAYHFQMVSPLAVALSILTFPVVVGLLWLGFAKIIVGLFSVTAGAAMAGPLTGIASWWIDAVRWASQLPGAWVELPTPSAAWAVTSFVAVFAVLSGWFQGRRLALTAVTLICIGWLYAPGISQRFIDRPALTVHMIDVGDGSCFVLRSGGQTMIFDCGSANFGQIGSYTIVPALKSIGVRRVDTLVVSHADIDHFGGTIDVIDHLPVDRVLMTRHTRAVAKKQIDDRFAPPRAFRATGELWLELLAHDIDVQFVEAGQRFTLGDASVEVIWPPPGVTFEDDNDNSIAMSITAAGRRVLMTGDIQAEAMQRMIDQPIDLAADVTDLPHHGSFPPPAVAWRRQVDPQVVLQSTGPARLRWDKWAGRLNGIDRYITARDGAVTLKIAHDGQITVQTFKAAGAPNPFETNSTATDSARDSSKR